MAKTTRREFLGAAAATTVAVGRSAYAASEGRTLRLGLIGAGGYGMTDARAALKAGGVEFAAVCDVDSEHLRDSADQLEKLQGKRPQTFKSYADLLELRGLEAVILATPPHWHALIFLATLEKGLDVYCEKPLGYDIREGRAMVDAAKRHDRIVQIGFQRRQSQAVQEAKQFIDSGGAGRIVQVDVQIHYNAGPKDATPQDPPASLDWDLWCGPAPKIPYSPQVGHRNWRLERTTGHGHLVDWGIHLIDATRLILGESTPRRIAAVGGLYCFQGKITTPDVLTVQFDFQRCPVVWRHRIWGAEEYTPDLSNGILFFGEKASVFVSDFRWVVLPRGKSQDRQEHTAKVDLGERHMSEFLDGVRSRKPPQLTIEDAYRSTTTVQLAMIAYETGLPVEWDETSEQIPGNPAAAKLLKRDYRPPWKHP